MVEKEVMEAKEVQDVEEPRADLGLRGVRDTCFVGLCFNRDILNSRAAGFSP